VKDLIARKVVRNDRLALGVMTFDGKGTWSRSDGEKVKGAQQSAYDAEGPFLQTFGALRAALTSSSVAPCVGQRLIGSKEGESTSFREAHLPAAEAWFPEVGSGSCLTPTRPPVVRMSAERSAFDGAFRRFGLALSCVCQAKHGSNARPNVDEEPVAMGKKPGSALVQPPPL